MNIFSKSSPLLGLVFLAVLSLCAIGGVVQAQWSDTLQVGGTVSTGRLDAVWTSVHCWDGEPAGKNLASVSGVKNPTHGNVIDFSITNGYPGYMAECVGRFTNNGTVPWMVRVIGFKTGTGLTNCLQSEFGSPRTLTCDQLEVVFWDGVGSVHAPGTGGASGFTVEVREGAGQNRSYQFWAAECLSQADLPMTPEQCLASIGY